MVYRILSRYTFSTDPFFERLFILKGISMTIRRGLLVILALLWVTAAAVVLAQDAVTISFSSWDTGVGGERNQNIIDQFTEETGVNVTVESQDGAEDPAILVRMAAGTAPDVIQAGEFNLKRRALASEGGFLDMTPLIEADAGFDPFTEYFPEVFNVGVIDGGVYAFNKDFATVAFYINTDMFEAAGIPIPEEGWTYDDLVEIAQELTLDANGNNATSPAFDPENIVQYGWWHPDSWVRGWQAIPYSYGATLLSDDGLTATGYLNTEAVVQSMELYRDSVHTLHISPSIASIQAQPGVDLFASGQAAIRGPHGPWNLTEYAENPDLNFALVPMPAGPEGRWSVICWAGFAVNRNTPHPQESYELVKYFATVGQNTFVEHALSANVAISDAAGKADDPLWGVFVSEIANLHPLDDLKTANWVECVNTPVSNLLAAIQSEGGDALDIQAELDTIATEADTCLDQPY
jgi:multiple sugar transport system substrate-binding protein